MTRPPRQVHDCRPLNTVELTPPDYRINLQYLVHSCVELQVKVCRLPYIVCISVTSLPLPWRLWICLSSFVCRILCFKHNCLWAVLV